MTLLPLLSGSSADYDLIIRNVAIYDGTGSNAFPGAIAVRGQQIAAVGNLAAADRAAIEWDGKGLAAAPGFINVLSWATESLLEDGRSQSDVRQGVTLEIMGEGESMGPLNPAMKKDMRAQQGDLRFEIAWTTLGEYLEHLVRRGVSCNVASFVGATTVRVHELGYADRPPTAPELERMRALVDQAMREGALGLGSSLIYAPAFYAQTEELIELAKVAARYGGIYITHLRSEGNRWLEAIDEMLRIGREAAIPCEIYHFKAAGQDNWHKVPAALDKIERARRDGQQVTADMYLYTAGATGLDAAMPPWVQEGGYLAWSRRLQDPEIRRRVAREMIAPADTWENFYYSAGPTNILLVGFKNERLKALTGKTLSEVARLRQVTPPEAAMDLVIEDGSRVSTVYFLMSEANVRAAVKLPWMTFGSDAASLAPEGVFLKSKPHPRAYGNFARLLGKYVRDEKLITLPEAIRRLTSVPAERLGLERRGKLGPGYFADIVLFDPQTVQDHATFENPHQYATGVRHVWVNGIQVLKDGEHTGAKPGQVVRGRGWRK